MLVTLLTVVTVVAGALAQGAAAKQMRFVVPSSVSALLSVKASDGYRAELWAEGEEVTLLLRSSNTTVSYTTRGTFKEDRIRARFGKLGRISVKLEVRSSKRSRPEKGCKGRPGIKRRVRASGTIRFRGERGFTRIRSSRTSGFVSQTFKSVCTLPSEGGEDEEPLEATGVIASPGSGALGPTFTAIEFGLGGGRSTPTAFVAGLGELQGRMLVYRQAIAASKKDGGIELSPVGESPATATVRPPAPFSGSATLVQSQGEDAAWTGNLSVELPGRGKVRLAGPSFEANFCREAKLSCLAGEFGALLERPAARAQISGSQSHDFGLARLSWSR
ncbi:MAG: hypothetical protein R2725_10385 [Solirubrobacterales bacterium]